MAIPSSLLESNPNYDNRMEKTLKLLGMLAPSISIVKPICLITEIISAHSGGQRNPDSLKENYQWRGFQRVPDSIVIVDDVITTGGHYVACKNFIKQYHQDIDVFGVFWARTFRAL